MIIRFTYYIIATCTNNATTSSTLAWFGCWTSQCTILILCSLLVIIHCYFIEGRGGCRRGCWRSLDEPFSLRLLPSNQYSLANCTHSPTVGGVRIGRRNRSVHPWAGALADPSISLAHGTPFTSLVPFSFLFSPLFFIIQLNIRMGVHDIFPQVRYF